MDPKRLEQLEERLRASEERYRLLVESVREYAIFTMDTDARITSWNEGARRILGYEEDEILGKSGKIIFTREDQRNKEFQKEIETARQRGQAINERWHIRKDGSRFWGSGVVTALQDHSGELTGFAKVMRDNTARRKNEVELQESKERLRKLNETLEERIHKRTAALREKTRQVRRLASDLVKAEQRERRRIAGVLHDDIQQILYGVQMKCSMLQQQAGEGRAVPAGDLVQIADYLSLAIRSTRELTVDLSPPVLKDEGLAETLEWLASQMRELHELDVTVRCDPGLKPADEGTRLLLFQTARELLFNVAKHAKTDRAEIVVHSNNGTLELSVVDEGAGFEAAEGDEGQRIRHGFGLSSIAEQLSLFGGRLEIHSARGKGTRVDVTVPATIGDAPDD